MTYRDSMERRDKARSGMALGGLGAGFFELRKDGVFYNWNIFNNYPLGTGEPFPMAEDSMLFFIVRYEVDGEEPRMKLLQVDEGYKVAAIPNHYYAFPWLTGVDRINYAVSFPFAHLRFSDAEMPLEVEMTAFSPFIPHEVKNSSLPTAVFDFRLRSTSSRPVDVMLMASMHNGVGYDVEDKFHVTKVLDREGYRLFELTEGGMDETHSSYGGQALASLAGDSTYYVGWEAVHPYYERVIRSRELPDYDDTEGRNKPDPETGELKAMFGLYGTIAVSRRLEHRQTLDHTFVTGWHFPNLYTPDGSRREGHYYNNLFDSAPDVVDYVVDNLPDLRGRSRQFVDDFRDSSAPPFVLDQVQAQLNTFFTSSWLTEEKNFGIQEGLSPHRSYGPLVTTDVSMYGSMSVAALFPELHKNMWRAHRGLQWETGEVAHGINRDFTQFDKQEGVTGRLDLPSQYVILSLLGYFWTGDREYLEEMWPSVKRALDYVLDYRDENGDRLPDMAGAMCTYDNFEMYGAASYVSSLWLGALRSAVEAAREAGDEAAESKYSAILDEAREAFERKLWNGEYYRLYNDEGGKRGDVDEGCLTDQVIGQWACRLTGLGEVIDPDHLRSALESVCSMCRRPWGLVNCRWPEDEFLHDVPESCWHDQANTCWSGVELAFASFLIYEGMLEEGLDVIEAVDRRYRRAGMYFDHIEFGGHYYRPMSAWAIVNALPGLTIRAGEFAFRPRLPASNLKLFFSFGQGTAHYVRRVESNREEIELRILSGTIECDALELGLAGGPWSQATVSVGGNPVTEQRVKTDFSTGEVRLDFPDGLRATAPDRIRIVLS